MKNVSPSQLLQCWRWRGQSGAFIVLTAVLLPFLVFLTGSVVDLGNIYIHHSYLQNSADAAALGGARVGWDTKKQTFQKDQADEKADALIDKNQSLFPIPDENRHKGYYPSKSGKNKKSKTGSSTHYYVVQLNEDVPLYFWKALTGQPTFAIEASAYAKIAATGVEEKPKKGSSYFTDLFVYSDKYEATNSMVNPDRDGASKNKHNISCTFNGHASYTDPNAKTIYSNQDQTGDFNFFATKKAKDTSVLISDIRKLAPSQYDSTGVDQADGYWSEAEYNPNINIQGYWDSIITPMIQANAQRETTMNLNSDTLSKKNVWVYDRDKAPSQNIDINIDKELSGSKDEPIYIIAKAGDSQWGGWGQIQINVNADTRRPLIICVDPSSKNTNLQFKLNINNGSNFRGMIYAPEANPWEGILVNAANASFTGSIISRYINLRGNNASYTYEGFGSNGTGTSGGGSGSSSKGASGPASVQLTNDDDKDIDWDSGES